MDGADRIDLLWVLLCTILVVLMQAGFLLLEAGAVRAKNRVNVAMKNLADFCVAMLAFWAVGFGLMFGATAAGLAGTGPFPPPGDAPAESVAFFLFQAAFCGTAATIVSGAVAERMSFAGYLGAAALVALLVYPVAGHWAWGGLLGGAPQGWLEARGFVDFAGSTVVHSVGGWVALAAVLRLGPRAGRFDGRRSIEGDNLALTATGGLLLWIGWFGFNGGSLLAFDDAVPGVLLATFLAAAAGGAAAVALRLLRHGRTDAMAAVNGVVGGLVAITAGAHLAGAPQALVLGAIGGLAAQGAGVLLDRARIDDAVGAIPAHLGAGIVGTLAVPFLAPAETGAPLERLGAQALGVGAIGAWSFGVAWPALWLIGRLRPLRATAEAESVGLNMAEHGAGSALYDLLGAMAMQSRRGDFSLRAPVEPGTEAGVVAAQYNRVLGRVEAEIAARERLAAELERARDDAEAASRAKSEFLATMSHEIRTPMNGVLGFAALLDGSPLDARQQDLVARIRASGESLTALLNDVLELAGADDGADQDETFRLDRIAEAVERRFGEAARAKGLGFSVACDDGPETARRGAGDRVRRIAEHLADNAVKFTERGEIAVRFAAAAEDVVIIVRDTGPGVPEADRARIFEPFTQGDASATRRIGGAGMGLAVVAGLAARMGGEATVEGAAGGGSAFRVRLPLPRAEPGARTTAA